jgi:predicted dehydrogenase
MSQLTRRQLLENSILAATAALAARAVPAPAEEAAGSASPNERINVAVVGVRGQGRAHLGAYARRRDTLVTYVCDADAEIGQARTDEVEKIQGFRPRFVQDVREVLDDAEVHAVSTATPNHWHALVSIWAMQAGKDVYVEKPCSHNVSEGRRMVEAARKYGRICQIGTQCRSMAATRAAIEYVQAGKIGQVKLARGLCYKPRGSIGPRGRYTVPSSVDYNLWLGPAPERPLERPNLHYDWHWIWDYGNGDLGNQGIHQMDIARWGLGLDRLSDAVYSYGGRLGYEDAGETANTQVIYHDYGDRTLVFEVRGLATDALKGAKVGVIFEGSEGYVVLWGYDAGAAYDLDGNQVASFTGGGDHFDNFLGAMRSRRVEDLHADILEGHLSSALCHMGNISYRLGQRLPLAEVPRVLDSSDETQETFERFRQHLAENGLPLERVEIVVGPRLKFDPQSEQFVEHAAANEQLTREYRAPFVVPAAGQV